MLDHAAKAGASWQQIGDARGTSADQARADYREWAEGQHDMHAGTGVWAGHGPQSFGPADAEYAEALARLDGRPPEPQQEEPTDLPDSSAERSRRLRARRGRRAGAAGDRARCGPGGRAVSDAARRAEAEQGEAE